MKVSLFSRLLWFVGFLPLIGIAALPVTTLIKPMAGTHGDAEDCSQGQVHSRNPRCQPTPATAPPPAPVTETTAANPGTHPARYPAPTRRAE